MVRGVAQALPLLVFVDLDYITVYLIGEAFAPFHMCLNKGRKPLQVVPFPGMALENRSIARV